MLSNRIFVCLLAVCVVSISFAGCRNRCQQQFPQNFQQFPGQNFQQFPQQNFQQQFPQQQFPQNFQQQLPQNFQQFPGQFGSSTSSFNPSAARSPVIPAPATGTLRIPSLARNNPFGSNQGLLNTNQAAPTAASNRSSQFNLQNGWQPVGSGSTSSGSSQSNQSNIGTTLGSAARSLVPTQANPTVAPGAAQSVLTQGSQTRSASLGNSFVRSPDYSTTSVNETLDRTRLPATDASAVRAPSQYYARASGAQVAQLPRPGIFGAPLQTQNFTGNNPGAFNVGSGTLQTGVRPVGVFAANSGAYVQSQSTATYDPYGDTRSADWRNRDSSTGSFQ